MRTSLSWLSKGQAYWQSDDKKRAQECYLKAVETNGYDGHAYACLADCYHALHKDDEKAFHCWLKSAELGYEPSYYMVGLSYLDGFGTERNAEEAGKWLDAAAIRADNPRAQVMMGQAYETGDLGVAKDLNKAFKRYMKAASKHNDPEAQFLVGYAYSQGLGIACKRLEAIRWYTKASAQGHDGATWNLLVTHSHTAIELADLLLRSPEFHDEASNYITAQMGLEIALVSRTTCLPVELVLIIFHFAYNLDPASIRLQPIRQVLAEY